MLAPSRTSVPGIFFLPSDKEEYTEKAQMAMIKLLGVSAIDISGVEETGEYHCTVNLQKFSRSLSKATLA